MIQRLKQIALFDLDGTLTRKDTLFEIIKHIHGKRCFYCGFLSLLPIFILFKLRLLPNWKAKESLLKRFFCGLSIEYFQQQCDSFALKILPQLFRADAMRMIENLRNKDVRIIIVSATAENWISAWCKRAEIEYIATHLEVKKGKLTGKIDGLNCFGHEKVRRIQSLIDLNEYEEIYAFGDSKGDIPMLSIASKPNYRIFKG